MDLTNQFFIKNLNGFLKFLFIISIVDKVAASIEEESLSTSDKFNQTTFSNNQLLHYFHNFFNYIFGIFYIFTEENQFSTYVCAIFSSLLVGLTGIIPLLVIPLIKVTENLQGLIFILRYFKIINPQLKSRVYKTSIFLIIIYLLTCHYIYLV